MLKIDMIVILSIKRLIYIESSITSEELKKLLGNPSNDEMIFIQTWNNNLNSQLLFNALNYYLEYESEDVAKLLEIKYRNRFPIAMTHIKLELRKQYILLYYIYKGFNVERYNKIFNAEQIEVITASNGITIVNAGPGTGKTTTACRKAYEFKNEGIIFISYTNASVDEDRKRMYDYPLTSSLMLSDGFNKSYVFGTIDKIAGMINRNIYETYDHSIKEATDKIKNLSFKQKHIIVDEAQDIDDLRSDFIYTLFFFGRFKSLTIFGDPRQKINEHAGMWYKNLWIHSSNNMYFNYKGGRSILNRIGFTISHRFKNKEIISLVNSLSSRRKELHCELFLNDSNIIGEHFNEPIAICNISNENEKTVMNNICDFIKTKHNEGLPYSEFIVVGPSLESDNKTSLLSKKIASFFRNYGIPCRLFSEGSYESNGVLFSTIQSVKGMEADYIFLFGLNNYPNSFSMIPYEEAESLIYVSHSRAKRKIFYINNLNSMILPRGIKDENILNLYKGMTFQLEEKDNEEYKPVSKKSVTSLVECFNFKKLTDTNELNILPNILNIQFPFLYVPDNISLDFYGTLIGIGVQMYCERKLPEFYTLFINNNYNVVNKTIYNQIKRQDDFINGKDEDNNIYVEESEDILLIKNILLELNTDINTMINKDYFILTTLLTYISTGINNEYNEEFDFDLNLYFKEIANIIEINFGKTIGTEVYVKKHKICGRIDILTESYIIELKTKSLIEDIDYLQPLIYSALNESIKIPILINLKLRQSYIINSNRIIQYWTYLIEKYNQIREQIDFLRYKTSKDTTPMIFPNNSFCIDTEFNPENNNEIVEIAIFNVNDPYKSIIQTVKVSDFSVIFGVSWLDLDADMFIKAPTLTKITEMFKRLVYLFDQKPLLIYYICNVDVSWYPNAIHFNLGKTTKEIGLKSGLFKNIISFPKLIDFYNSHIEFISYQPHLKHHTALSDSLMLYAILKMYNQIK